MRLYNLILIIFSFVLISCNLDCKNANINFVNKNIRSYFIFNNASYWVYKNQNRGKTDSIFVSFYEEKLDIINKTTCSQSQQILMTLKSSNKHLILSDSVNMVAELKQYRSVLKFSSDYTFEPTNPVLVGEIRSFYIDIDKISVTANNYQSYYSSYAKIKTEVPLNGQLYNGYIQHYIDTIKNVNLFIQKDLGIIGWANSSDTFNLTNYQVKK